jgi:hypothetical protein
MDSKEHLGLYLVHEFLEVPYLAFSTKAVMKEDSFFSSFYYEGTLHENSSFFRL